MGCSFVAARINSKENVIILWMLRKVDGVERVKKNQKWIQCKLRVEGDASNTDDRKTILWTC